MKPKMLWTPRIALCQRKLLQIDVQVQIKCVHIAQYNVYDKLLKEMSSSKWTRMGLMWTKKISSSNQEGKEKCSQGLFYKWKIHLIKLHDQGLGWKKGNCFKQK